MRTVKRNTLALNAKKQKALDGLCRAYAREKRYWLPCFQAWNFQSYLRRSRAIRDEYVKKGYRSCHGLQARHWKLALEDAAETWDKYWQATFVNVRLKISHRKDLSETERHYAYWLLKSYPSFAAMMQGKCPESPFPIETLREGILQAMCVESPGSAREKRPLLKKPEVSDLMLIVMMFLSTEDVNISHSCL